MVVQEMRLCLLYFLIIDLTNRGKLIIINKHSYLPAPIAQLAERIHGKDEVISSTLIGSSSSVTLHPISRFQFMLEAHFVACEVHLFVRQLLQSSFLLYWFETVSKNKGEMRYEEIEMNIPNKTLKEGFEEFLQYCGEATQINYKTTVYQFIYFVNY